MRHAAKLFSVVLVVQSLYFLGFGLCRPETLRPFRAHRGIPETAALGNIEESQAQNPKLQVSLHPTPTA